MLPPPPAPPPPPWYLVYRLGKRRSHCVSFNFLVWMTTKLWMGLVVGDVKCRLMFASVHVFFCFFKKISDKKIFFLNNLFFQKSKARKKCFWGWWFKKKFFLRNFLKNQKLTKITEAEKIEFCRKNQFRHFLELGPLKICKKFQEKVMNVVWEEIRKTQVLRGKITKAEN